MHWTATSQSYCPNSGSLVLWYLKGSFRLHVSARPWYLAFSNSWNHSVLSSQGTVNSTSITYLNTRTILIYLVCCLYVLLSWENYMCVPRSTLFFSVSSSLTKLMNFGLVLSFLSLSRMSTVLLSTRSLSHLYRSCDIATGQNDIRRCSVCLTGTWDFLILKASIVSDRGRGQHVLHGSEKKIQLECLIFPQLLSE